MPGRLSGSASDSGLTTMGREGWRIRTRATTVIRCTAYAFLLEAQLQAWDGDAPIFERRWDHRVPRDQV